MFYNGQFPIWFDEISLKDIQKMGHKDNTFSLLNDIKKKGGNVANFHEESALKRSQTQQKLFEFSQLPSVWPFVLAKQLYNHLPTDWAKTLKKARIGEVNINQINAMALDGDIGLLTGLSNFFLMCSFASSPFNYQISDINHTALELGIQAKNVAAKLIMAKSYQEYTRLYSESINLRSHLANKFPKERPIIERFATSTANDMIRFVLMHELAHIFLKHKNATKEKSQYQEFEADRHALYTLTNIFHKTGISPISGSLAMSFLEAKDRLNGITFDESIKYHENSSHPPHYQRRGEILENASAAFYKYKIKNDTVGILLSMVHMMHIELSSLLERSGFAPLTQFHNSMSLKCYGISSIPPFIKYASEKVMQLELYPYHVIGLI